jgi:putative MATE family efflux protein
LRRRDLTEGPVSLHLLRLGLPMVLGVAAVFSVSFADAYFLGQLGTDELAAISFTFPVVLTLTSLGIGLSAGATSVVSRALGGGNDEGVKRLSTDSLFLAAVIMVMTAILGALVVRPLFALLGAEGEVLEMVVRYMRIWFLSLPLLVVPMVAMGLIRANGDGVAPSLVLVGGAVLNVGLDPLLIFGTGPLPELGIAGAAWATFIARVAMLGAAFYLVTVREELVTKAIPSMGEFLRSAGQVLKIGLPAAGSNMINPLSISIVTAFLASYGNETVAGFGVATRIEALITVPMLALSSAIGPVAGQNWGREEPKRTVRVMRDAFLICILCGLVLGGVLYVFVDRAVELFTDDSVVANTARSYLIIVGLTLGGYGVVINASAALNAIDKALLGLAFTVLRSFALYVPLAYAGTMLGPAWVVFGGIAVSNIVAGLIVAFAAIIVVRRAIRS